MCWTTRFAAVSDTQALHALLVRSAYELQKNTYSLQQIQAAIGPVFGVDEQMIADQTYFVVERGAKIVGCGGWSFREALFGGRSASTSEPRRLNIQTEAARIRAFFVDPEFSRQGIGSIIMKTCEAAICAHGFKQGEISATLVGEALYRRFGYVTTGYYDIPLEGAQPLRVARMVKTYQQEGEQAAS
jgi:GNAT superfamily N-acetyltransferase